MCINDGFLNIIQKHRRYMKEGDHWNSPIISASIYQLEALKVDNKYSFHDRHSWRIKPPLSYYWLTR